MVFADICSMHLHLADLWSFLQATQNFAIKYFGQIIQTVRLRTLTVLQADTLFNCFTTMVDPLELYL